MKAALLHKPNGLKVKISIVLPSDMSMTVGFRSI
jgi:hypothetical protein